MRNLPNDQNVRMLLTPLFIKRNREQKGSLSWAPMTTTECLEHAMERQIYKAYVALLLCRPITHSGPGGVKVSAKAFTPPVHPKREMEWWKENTRGNRGGQVALLMTLECDGNAVNEEGWDKKLCFPRRDRQAWEESEEQHGSADIAEQSQAKLCRPQEYGMNRVWLRDRQRWHRDWEAPLFLLLFPLLSEKQWQLSGEDQKGGRWKVRGSGRKREKRETVAPGGYISSQ